MKIINAGKSHKNCPLVNIRINKFEKGYELFIDNVMMIKVVCEPPGFRPPPSKVVSIQQSMKEVGVYVRKDICPEQILKSLSGDDDMDIKHLVQVFECFQRVYPSNNSNYAFLKCCYYKMLNRFFVHPYWAQNAGKGPNLAHYFMDIPIQYND